VWPRTLPRQAPPIAVTITPTGASARASDSDHNGPIFPDLARHKILDGPNQVWVADITYIAIAAGFVYMAAILDAWSRRVVGYAISNL
jgi:transposase InsO family protein